MIALFRQIILCVTAASLFGAVVLALVKDGAIKEILRMGVGLVLVLSLVVPLRRIVLPELTDIFPKSADIQSENAEQLYQAAILKQTEAEAAQYVVNLADEYSIDCSAEVTAEAAEDGTVSISVVRIFTKQSIPNEQQYALRRQIVQELGAEQIYITPE